MYLGGTIIALYSLTTGLAAGRANTHVFYYIIKENPKL